MSGQRGKELSIPPKQQLKRAYRRTKSPKNKALTFGTDARPLVALLDGKDCSIEMGILKDVATVAFCDAHSGAEIHDTVLSEAIGILVWHTIILTDDIIAKFKKLKMIVKIGASLDNIDVRAATAHGIAVCNVPGIGVEETADSTMCLILNLYRRTNWFANVVQDGKSVAGPEHLSIGGECSRIRGETLGIIGLGRIGSCVAIRAKAFGFNVICYDPYLPDGSENILGLSRVFTLEELLCQADCITLHCTINEFNQNFINERTIKYMRPGVFFVNTARGGLVDEAALAEALKTGHIKAAALDVHKNEPHNIFDGPLRSAPNIISTPHSAFISTLSVAELRQSAAKEIRRGLTGIMPECFRNCANAEHLAEIAQAVHVSNVLANVTRMCGNGSMGGIVAPHINFPIMNGSGNSLVNGNENNLVNGNGNNTTAGQEQDGRSSSSTSTRGTPPNCLIDIKPTLPSSGTENETTNSHDSGNQRNERSSVIARNKHILQYWASLIKKQDSEEDEFEEGD